MKAKLFVEIAATQVGVRELKGNRGPKVAEYLRIVGLNEGYAWCAGFVCWCVDQVCKQTKTNSPMVYSAGVLAMYNQNKRLQVKEPRVGDIFIMRFGQGKGHTGIVTGVTATQITTIEGNTNDGGSREGDGVYRRTRQRNTILGYLRPYPNE